MSQPPEYKEQDLHVGFRGRASANSSRTSVEKPVDRPPDYQDDNEARVELKGWRLGAVLFCVFFGVFISTIESSITATILVTVSEHFGDFDLAPWVVLAYLLTYMGFAMIFARISDVFGRKWCIIAAHGIFLAANMACGLSQSMMQLVIFRAVAGIGGAGLYSLNMAAWSEVVPFRMMGMVAAGMGATLGGAGCLGPIMGGLLAKVNWRWAFLFNGPACSLAIVLMYFSWHEERPEKREPILQQLKTIDYLGATLLLTASTTVTFALQEGSRDAYSWTSPIILSFLAVSGMCWTSFGFWQYWLSKRGSFGIVPIFPVRSFSSRVMFGCLNITLVNGCVFYSAVVNLPERYQIVNLKSAIGSGVCLLPLVGVAGSGAFFAGMANQKKNNTFLSFMVTIPCLGAGIGLLSTVNSNKTLPWHAYTYEALLAVGVGPVMTVVTLMSNAYAEYEDLGAVQGAIAQTRIIGGSMGLSMANIVIYHKLKNNLRSELTPEQITTVTTQPDASKSFSPAQAELVRLTYADGYKETFRILAFIAIACLVAGLITFQRHPPPLGVKAKHKDIPAQQRRSMMVLDDEETGHGHVRGGRPASFYPLTLPEDFDIPFGLSEDFYRHISVYFKDGIGGHRGPGGNRKSRFSRWMGGGEGGHIWGGRHRMKLPRGKTV